MIAWAIDGRFLFDKKSGHMLQGKDEEGPISFRLNFTSTSAGFTCMRQRCPER